MADLAQAASTPVESESMTVRSVTFSGSSRNLVPAMALIAAGLAAPVMGLTTVYFAEAMAWTFVIWGLLFLYMGLLDAYKTYEFTDDSLIIRSPFRFWNYKKVWDWANVIRMDVKVKQPDAPLQDAELQIYWDVPGEVEVEREDRDYDPAIAQGVVEHAGLSSDSDEFQELDHLPFGQRGIYTWRK